MLVALLANSELQTPFLQPHSPYQPILSVPESPHPVPCRCRRNDTKADAHLLKDGSGKSASSYTCAVHRKVCLLVHFTRRPNKPTCYRQLSLANTGLSGLAKIADAIRMRDNLVSQKEEIIDRCGGDPLLHTEQLLTNRKRRGAKAQPNQCTRQSVARLKDLPRPDVPLCQVYYCETEPVVEDAQLEQGDGKEGKEGKEGGAIAAIAAIAPTATAATNAAEEEGVCGICMDSFPRASADTRLPPAQNVLIQPCAAACNPCGVELCFDCVREYFTRVVMASRYSVPSIGCPSCQQRQATEHWRRFVQPSVFTVYRANAWDLLTMRCPECDLVGSFFPSIVIRLFRCGDKAAIRREREYVFVLTKQPRKMCPIYI